MHCISSGGHVHNDGDAAAADDITAADDDDGVAATDNVVYNKMHVYKYQPMDPYTSPFQGQRRRA